ncbi:MAG: DUF2934 domain-containing protein [Kiloniellales bacterium]
MESPPHSEIERRAYAIWEAEGRPVGRALEHWFRAEHELQQKQKSKATSARGKATKAPTARKRSSGARAKVGSQGEG